MKISIFTTVSNPHKSQYAYLEALQNYLDFADEVVVINGGEDFPKINHSNIKYINYKWPEEFGWKFIGQQFQRGYDACTGDVVIRMDIDYLFHENDFDDIRKFIDEELEESPVAVMPKKQFILVDRFRVKALIPMIFNKKMYGDRIKLNAGGDLCQPSLDEKEISVDEMPIVSRKEYVVVAEDTLKDKRLEERLPGRKLENEKMYTLNKGICFYNYDFSFKEKEIVKKDFGRFARAWHQTFNKWTIGGPSDESALDYFEKMMIGRINGGGWEKCKLEDHPKCIQDKVKNILPEQLGHDLWGKYKRT